MKRFSSRLAAILLLFCLALSGCSGSKNQDQAKESKKTSTEQAADAIKEYGARPIDKARAAQQIGVERTDAIDEAVKQK